MVKLNVKNFLLVVLFIWLFNSLFELLTENQYRQLYWIFILGFIGCYLLVTI